MSENSQKRTISVDKLGPKSFAVASKGIESAGDFHRLMESLMQDLLNGDMTAATVNAVTNEAGKRFNAVSIRDFSR